MTGLLEGICQACGAATLVRGNGKCNPCSGYVALSAESIKRRKVAGRARFWARELRIAQGVANRLQYCRDNEPYLPDYPAEGCGER